MDPPVKQEDSFIFSEFCGEEGTESEHEENQEEEDDDNMNFFLDSPRTEQNDPKDEEEVSEENMFFFAPSGGTPDSPAQIFGINGGIEPDSEDSDSGLSCPACQQDFPTVTARMKHERIHSDLYEQCTVCGEHYFRTRRLMHLRTHEIDVCNICEESVVDIKRHVTTQHYNCHECDVCNKKLSSADRLKYHKIVLHGAEKVYPCRNCNIIFNSQEELDEHDKLPLKSHHVECPVCDKTLGKKEYVNFRGHLLSHALEETKNLEGDGCTRCFRKFEILGHVQNHLVGHYMPAWKFECSKCFAVWVSEKLQVRHETDCDGKLKRRKAANRKLPLGPERFKKQPGNKYPPQQCPHCAKVISNIWSLRVHVSSVHEGKVVCKRCHKMYDTKKERDEHMKVHAKTEQANNCVLCGKKITYANMKNHLLSHAKQDIKDLIDPVCPECNRVFDSLNQVRNHLLAHYQPQRNTECRHCCLPVKSPSELEQHESRCEEVIGKKKRSRVHNSASTRNVVYDPPTSNDMYFSDEIWQCSSCQETYASQEECLAHIETFHSVVEQKVY